MKRFLQGIITIITLICCCHTAAGFDLPSEGDWKRNIIRKDSTIILTGHVELLGTITVSSGCTLTIRNNTTTLSNGKEEDYKRIRATSDMNADGTSAFVGAGFSFNGNRPAMFLVEEGATLRILGKSDKARITINGGTGTTAQRVLDSDGYLEKLETDGKHPVLNGGAICTVGTLVMKNAVIHNVYSEYEGGGILSPRVKDFEIKCGPITLTDCVIRDCQAGHGAAIMLKNQRKEKNTDPSECAVTLTDVTINHCYATSLDQYGVFDEGGGIVRSNGDFIGNLILNNVEIKYCRSECHGAGVYWNGHGLPSTICKMSGCTFEKNNSKECGGTMVLESSFDFVGPDKTYLDYNKAGNLGGGIYIMAYNATLSNSDVVNLQMEMNEYLRVRHNIAGNGGGGIAFKLGNNVTFATGSKINVDIDGAAINDNKVTSGSGGGIYFYNDINNEKGITISLNINDGYLRRNEALNGNGGSIFCTTPEASYPVTVPTLNLNAGDISSNKAINGAGIYVDRQVITSHASTDGVRIRKNVASGYGGGIAVTDGGSLTISTGVVEDNKAKNGGGMYIGNNGVMTFGNGLIRNNQALSGGNPKTFTTGYNLTADNLVGMGGGIFLDTGASLTFADDTNLGLYGNTADYGADDIFANGNGTLINLPDVTHMQLSGFEVPTQTLYWVEDYVDQDAEYEKGTFVNKKYSSGENLPERYRYALANLHEIFTVSGGVSLTNYVCLALGYQIIFVTITKSGLKAGESAVFQMYQEDSPDNIYQVIALTGKADGSVVSSRVALYSGKWTVRETDWSWAYKPDKKSITKTITSNSVDNVFSFTNTEDKTAPLHDEAIVVNTMQN